MHPTVRLIAARAANGSIGVFLACFAVAMTVAISADQRQSRERSILVGATANGVAITNLGETDFIVREDGLAREVIRVAPAPPPSHVYLLIDDSQAAQPAVPFLRGGVTAFVRAMSKLTPAPQTALMTFGDRPTKRQDFTTNAAAVQQAGNKIFSILGTGAYFLQAIREASQDLRKRSAASPVIVAFVAEGGPEFSSEHRKQIRESLQASGASLWVIVLQDTNDDLTPEARERAAVIGDVTVESGGTSRVSLSTQGLEPAFEGVAAMIASRYLVTYGRPDQLIPPQTIEVTAKRADVRIVASRWVR